MAQFHSTFEIKERSNLGDWNGQVTTLKAIAHSVSNEQWQRTWKYCSDISCYFSSSYELQWNCQWKACLCPAGIVGTSQLQGLRPSSGYYLCVDSPLGFLQVLWCHSTYKNVPVDVIMNEWMQEEEQTRFNVWCPEIVWSRMSCLVPNVPQLECFLTRRKWVLKPVWSDWAISALRDCFEQTDRNVLRMP